MVNCYPAAGSFNALSITNAIEHHFLPYLPRDSFLVLDNKVIMFVTFHLKSRIDCIRLVYRTEYRNSFFSQGRGKGRFFEGGRLLKILSLMRGAYLKLGANSNIIILWIVFGADCLVL